ncbi:MAG: hypothetical protein OER87_10865 [Gammaproteobacteria bacterium]|nr:hypothetical protein [Gammaproteobacteria bacterium]
MLNRLEYTTAGEKFLDFCLWEYTPIAPFESKLRPVSLLFHSFDFTGIDVRAFELVEAIRDRFGASNTVWGVKKLGNDIAWEFYFYDYRIRERERSVAKFVDIVRPFADCEVPVNEDTPYFMFSVDVDEGLVTGSSNLDEIHIYIGNTGSTVSSGIAYSVKTEGIRLENFYFFFNAKEQMEQIVSKAACSAYFQDTQNDVSQILWPELRDCSVIVVANKQNNDSIYFSRINVDQLIFFLRRMDYPDEICRFVEAHRAELDHLLFDVGFDYRMEGNDVDILKSGYYGIF